MFNSKELSLFQTSYFSDFKYQNEVIEVRSINTGHWWLLLRMDMPRATMIVIKHRYPGVKKYYLQCHIHTFNKAIRLIKDHDAYILAKNDFSTISL
jgi:hypothetical protein